MGFPKLLTKTDIQQRLSLPTKFFKSLPSFNGSHVQDLEAMDESGRVWTFQCSVRKKGHPRPVLLSKGWRAFVRNKKLKVDDKIEFSVLNQTAGVPSYMVQAVQAENVQAEKVQEEKVQAEKVQAENVQAEKVQEENVQAEKVQAEKVQEEKVKAEKVQAENVQAVKEVKVFGTILGYSPIIATSIP